MAAIEVTDSGKGIDAELLPHIFERFRQGDSSSTRHHGGLGLGLTIAHQLVVMHGGEIEVHGAGEGRGSRFTVLLPIVALATNPEPPHLRSSEADSDVFPAHSLRGFHIMVVDDKASVRDLVALTLTKCGASVTVANSVQDALGLMPNLAPDVIVSDIAMPDIDGYAFIKKIRALASPPEVNIPVIALTAYASVQDRRRAYRVRIRKSSYRTGRSRRTGPRHRQESPRETRARRHVINRARSFR